MPDAMLMLYLSLLNPTQRYNDYTYQDWGNKTSNDILRYEVVDGTESDRDYKEHQIERWIGWLGIKE